MQPDYTVDLTDGIDQYDQADLRAQERLAADGLSIPEDRPLLRNGEYFDGRLPANVNSLGSRELGDLFGMMTLWVGYVQGRFTLAQAAVRNAETKLGLAKARIRKSKSGTMQDKEDSTICDSRYVAVQAEWLESLEYKDLLEGILEAAKRDQRFISRLIEVLRIEMEGNTRENHVNSRQHDRRDFGRRPAVRPR